MKCRIICSAFRPLVRLISRAGSHGKLSILIYHRVLPNEDPLRPREVTARMFNWQMEFVVRCFHALSVAEAASRLRSGSLPAGAICVTFDDGYRDNAEVALPLLEEKGIPGTFFISTGYLDGGRMWNDTVTEAVRRMGPGALDLTAEGLGYYFLEGLPQRVSVAEQLIRDLKYRESGERQRLVDHIAALARSDLPKDLMMDSSQVRELRDAGMEVGAHTVTHPILAKLDDTQARYEITESRKRLEALIGQPVRVIAYPNGRPGKDYGPVHVEMVREEGFEAAVTTLWGISDCYTSPWELRRFTPWDTTPVRFAMRLLLNYRYKQFS